MKTIPVIYKGKTVPCSIYSHEDDFMILNIFFNWRMQEQLASASELKRPSLPTEFSTPFCCRVLDLAHSTKSSKSEPNCFEIGRVEDDPVAIKTIEIKSTITEDGFTDIKKDLDFDELCWLDCSNYKNLSFYIYQFTKEDLRSFISESKTQRNSVTVHMAEIAKELGVQPVFEGKVGISVERIEWEKVNQAEEDVMKKILESEEYLFAL